MSVARAPIDSIETFATVATVATIANVEPTPPPPHLMSVPFIWVQGHGSLRRSGELLIATAALLLLAPLLLVIALVVATTSAGPVLYRQERIGIGGRRFQIVKFRTMRAGAEEVADELFALQDDGSGPLHKLHDDPRVTPPGRWLRRYSLDELPQLWNVLNGSMALVGPRPTTPDEVAQFTPRDHLRHAVRPGITGITQVSGRSDLEWDDAVRLDLHYIEHRSLWLDLRILLRTVPAVVRARGAY